MFLRRLTSASGLNPTSYRLPPTIRQLLAASDASNSHSQTTVSGWIKSIRKQKNVAFAVVTDGSSARGLQAVFVGGTGEEVQGLTNGAAVRLTGKLVPSPGAGQAKELLVDFSKSAAAGEAGSAEKGKLEILGHCDTGIYPIQKKALSAEYLRDHAHLRARTDAIAAMIRLRDGLTQSIGAFFQDQGFCYTHTPVLTGNDAEGAGDAFRIADVEHPASAASALSSSPASHTQSPEQQKPITEFFSRPAFLTVSHQLHLEALATALSRVYTLSPCFRAERSLTGRHLAEFWMLEAEWAFGGGNRVDDVCMFVEACLRNVVGGFVGPTRAEDVEVLWKGGDERKRRLLEVAFDARAPWTRISYTEAVNALVNHHSRHSISFRYEPKWGRPLQSEHERWVAESLIKGPVFITDYPASLKPFYMRMNEDGVSVACFDLVVPFVGELVGGSVREERVDVLEEKMGVAMKHSMEEYQWYLDLRRYGGAPHAGFGMGFERLVGWVGGIDNIRECVPMPRWAGRMLL